MSKEIDKSDKKTKVIDEWLKINVLIHNELEKLKTLDAERDEIGNLLTTMSEVELKEKMEASIKKYENVLANIQILKIKAQKLATQLNKKK